MPLRRYSLLLLLLSAGLLGLVAWPRETGTQREQAMARWASNGLANYTIALDVEIRGERCFQQLEVHQGQVQHVVQDTCESPWLEQLSVPQIFSMAAELEEIPNSRCHPTNQDCVCHRFFTTRRIDYHPTLGYPETILTYSEVDRNWQHRDFWERVLDQRNLPSCGGPPRLLMIRVLWMVPLGG